MNVPREPVSWDPADVVRRVNQARGAYLQRNGRDLLWAEIGRANEWIQATTSDVKLGKRPLRLGEVAVIAQLLECSPGWLAFGEGMMRPLPAETPGIPNAEPGQDAYEWIDEQLAQQAAQKPPAKKRRAR